jgi:hypothetical protein
MRRTYPSSGFVNVAMPNASTAADRRRNVAPSFAACGAGAPEDRECCAYADERGTRSRHQRVAEEPSAGDEEFVGQSRRSGNA